MNSRHIEDEYDREEAKATAVALDLTPDELNEIEYVIHEIANDDGLVYGYGVEIKKEHRSTSSTRFRGCPGAAT
ncbi:hypothetical protein HAP48_0004830 [Bradyrhizobium septentrionale]|uniref:Uncharacterized protein n=1 Tax=Bradyrhizobium septentrionale TaxID=1404411 RepID=A0A974A4J2_9BRAD|nr:MULTISPECIES: hypothetical protein [Bradyrhizobium]UGY16849.1 hypothetical protein HAP48_0004830 [Bradyrhizobium septentrionale]